MQEVNQFVASRLKQLRKQRAWSLDRTAKETGVSKAMLGQIERGESSPTIATLWKIAGGFHTGLSYFIDRPAPSVDDGGVIDPHQLRHQPASDSMLVASVFPYEQRFGFEFFELTLLPGYERISLPHETGVTEHVIVIAGALELLIDGEWLHLDSGDALRFAADKPHGYRNMNDSNAVFHNLIHYNRSEIYLEAHD